MHGDLPWNGFIQDIPERFITMQCCCIKKKTWLASQENGFEIIKQRYARILFETNSMRQM
jgi:hypothetical protein